MEQNTAQPGRPKMPDSQRKSALISFRTTQAIADALDTLRESRGLSRREMIEKLIQQGAS